MPVPTIAPAPARETMERLHGLEVLRLGGLGDAAEALVSTRRGGVSVGAYESLNLGDHVGDDPRSVAENRRRFAAALEVAAGDLAIARQVHGTEATVAHRGGDLGEADALVAVEPGVVLVVLVADCLPIVLLDAEAGVLCLVHAGWRGTALGVCQAAVDAMAAQGAEPARCVAVLGPCVSPATYEVGDDVVARFEAAGLREAIVEHRGGRVAADLRLANARQLHHAGVPLASISASSWSTDGAATFFSDRWERPCGRFALAARLRGARS